MKRLAIYSPTTGAIIPLDQEAYLVDLDRQPDPVLEALQSGERVTEWAHCGFRLDNYNMTNLFYE
jgi:hypothetical protein